MKALSMLHPALSCIEGNLPSLSPWTEGMVLSNFSCSRIFYIPLYFV